MGLRSRGERCSTASAKSTKGLKARPTAQWMASAATGVTSTFSLQNHDSVFNSGYQIEAVVVTARGLGEGGTFLKPVIRSGTSTAEGPGTPLELSFLPARGIFHVDPATGAAWTNSAINALEVGVKLDTVP